MRIYTLSIAIFFVGTLHSQNKQIPLIESQAPSFTTQSTNGKFTFPNDFEKSWKVLFCHPQDFTPVCSSELLELAYLQDDLKNLNVQFAVIFTDNVSQHSMWKAHVEELDYKGRGKQQILFPILEDSNKKASIMYGMLHTSTSTSYCIKGVYIIDPGNIVRSINSYPIEVGRNILEIERTIIALQIADNRKILPPANWEKGDDLLMKHYPYTDEGLTNNPELELDYYQVGDRLWFKKEK